MLRHFNIAPVNNNLGVRNETFVFLRLSGQSEVFLVVFLDGITLRPDKPPERATDRGPLTVAAVHGGVGGTEAPE